MKTVANQLGQCLSQWLSQWLGLFIVATTVSHRGRRVCSCVSSLHPTPYLSASGLDLQPANVYGIIIDLKMEANQQHRSNHIADHISIFGQSKTCNSIWARFIPMKISFKSREIPSLECCPRPNPNQSSLLSQSDGWIVFNGSLARNSCLMADMKARAGGAKLV